jgi:predicted small integral membrane protein
MENKLKTIEKRAMQYWFADGLAEIYGASICVLLAIYFAAQQIIPQSSFAIFFLLVFVLAYGMRMLMYRQRQHSTYPRTGYLEAKTGRQNRSLLVVAIAFTVLLLAFMLYSMLEGINNTPWLTVLSGSIIAFLFFMAASEAKLCRFYYLAGFSILLGVGLLLIGLGDFWGMAIHSLVIGVSLTAFGIRTRLSYLRNSIIPLEHEDES